MYSIQQAFIAVRSSLWLIPSLLVASSMLLAFVLIALDDFADTASLASIPWLFGAQADGSRGMLTAIATSMITVAGVTFSITINALAQASSQYSPLILRNFMRDRANQVVLGIFGGIFVYSLVVLRSIRGGDNGFVPSLAVLGALVYAIIGIGFLLFFIHHIATVLQASSVLAMVSKRTEGTIDTLFPEQLGRGEDEVNRPVCPEADLAGRFWYSVCPRETGYIQAVRTDDMLQLACRYDAIVRMEQGIGEFAIREVPIASIALKSPPEEEVLTAVADLFIVGGYRTIDQDAAFGVRQIVDMAVKALSPGINDPTTAGSCLDYLCALLVRLAPRRLTTRERYHNGELRVLALGPSYEALVDLAFDQIRQAVRNDVVVFESIIEAIKIIALRARSPSRRNLMLRHLRLVDEHARVALEQTADRNRVAGLVEKALREIASGSSDPASGVTANPRAPLDA